MKRPFLPLLLLAIAIGIAALFLNFQNREYPIPPEVKTLLDKAEVKRCEYKFDSTVFYLQQAQNLYRKLGKEKEATALYGRILYIYPESDSATKEGNKKWIAEAKTALEKLSNADKKEIENQIELGVLRYMLYVLEISKEKSILLAEGILEKAAAENDWEVAAATCNVLASLVEDKKKADKYALEAYSFVEKNLKKHHEEKAHLYYIYPYFLFYIYSDLADHYRANSDYENAIKFQKKSLTDALEKQIAFDSLMIHTAYYSIAFIYGDKGDHDKSREYFEYALAYISYRFPHAFAHTMTCIGRTYQLQSKHENAIEWYEKALQNNHLTRKGQGNIYIYRYYRIYQGLATSYSKLGQFDKAKVALDSLDKLPADKDSEIGVLNTKGSYYRLSKDYDKARKYFNQALEKYPPTSGDRAGFHWNLAQIDADTKQYASALEQLQKALGYLVPDFKETNFKKNPSFEQITDKHDVISYLIDKLRMLRLFAQEKNALPEYAESITELTDLTVKVFEAVRNSYEREGSKRNLLESAYSTYESAIATHFDLYEQTKDLKHLQKAFDLSEHNKSVLLMDAMKENKALSFAGIPDSLTKKEVELANNAAFYEQQAYWALRGKDTVAAALHKKYLFEARAALDEIKTLLEKNYPNYYELKYKSSFISVDELQKNLAADEALLAYFEGKDELFVFSIDNKGLKGQRITKPEGYNSEVEKLRTNLTDLSAISSDATKAFSDFAENSHRFYQKYIGNAIPKASKRLFIIPDGLLCYLPFETFITTPVAADKAMGKLPYLMATHHVSYDYSATLWASRKKRKISEKPLQVLAMAASYEEKASDTEMSNERTRSIRNSLQPIPGTVEEVEMLKNKFGGRFLSKATADEPAFKENAKRYGLIHLAMHGLVDNKQPEYSGLVFTENKKNKEDDFLHAYEIKSMQLNADLVVLSACETGFGKFQHGEGVASLGRSFMYAGVPSMVMTLWQLHDQSSVKLIELFYKYLDAGMYKDEALRQAKLDYIAANTGKASHPAFWGCFVQLGDNRPIKIEAASRFGGNWLWWGLGATAALTALFFMLKGRKNKAA